MAGTAASFAAPSAVKATTRTLARIAVAFMTTPCDQANVGNTVCDERAGAVGVAAGSPVDLRAPADREVVERVLDRGVVGALGQADDGDDGAVLDDSSNTSHAGHAAQRLGGGVAGGRGAQGRLERLPDVGHRQGLENGHRPGCGGLLWDVVAGPVTQLLGGRDGSGGEGDERDGDLAGV